MLLGSIDRRPRVTLFAAVVLAAAAIASAGAQEVLPAETFPPPQIEAFAHAVVEVQGVQQELAAQLPLATSDAEAARLEAEAQDRMVDAVEGAGLTVDEYNRILHAAQADPALYARIVEAIEGGVR